MNYELIAGGYYPANISADIDRKEYYRIVDLVNATHNYAPIINAINQKLIEGVTVNVTVNIIKMVQQNPKITIDAIASTLNVNRRTVTRHLKRLQTAQKVRRIGSDKTGHWEVVG
jgi:predicted HTH transcriptional regulator